MRGGGHCSVLSRCDFGDVLSKAPGLGRATTAQHGQRLSRPGLCISLKISPKTPPCFFSSSCSRLTIFVRLHTNEHQELRYLPGDHLGVFPGNHEDLVNALIDRLEDAPPANQLVKVELLEERNTALGNQGHFHVEVASPPHPSFGVVLVAPWEGRWPPGEIGSHLIGVFAWIGCTFFNLPLHRATAHLHLGYTVRV